MNPQETENERWQKIRLLLAQTPLPEPSESFVQGVIRCLLHQEEPQPVWPRRALPSFSWRLVPRWAAGVAALTFWLAMAQPREAVGTEVLLLEELPEEARWAFSAEPPDAGILLG